MLIDRERFLRAALLMSLGGAPVTGCVVVPEDETATEAPEQSSGGEQQPVQQQTVGQPVMVRTGPSYEGGPAYEAGPAVEGGPAYEGSPVVEGGPAFEGGAPVYE